LKGNQNMEMRTTSILRVQRLARVAIVRVLIVGALTCVAAFEAHAVPGMLEPGGRSGVLQQTVSGVVRIDGVNYPLAAGAVIQTSRGIVLRPKMLEKMRGHMEVQYWLGTGAMSGEIVHMVLSARQ
jgi:hypothetical protein